MARFNTIAIGQEDLVSSATSVHKLGTRAESDDGRVFRYVKAGEALVAGNLIQSSAIVPDHLATTATATSVGARSLTFTPGATAGAANLYADGYLGVSDSNGAGYTYGVDSHAAITASVAFTLYLKDAVQIALTTGSKLGLIANPYKNVIKMPATTATGSLVGAATYIIASGEYGWVQTWGLCNVLVAGTPALGAIVMAPGAVAGAVEIIVAAANLIVAQPIGNMAQVGVNTKFNWVYLRINP
jgi:hypothetical protein